MIFNNENTSLGGDIIKRNEVMVDVIVILICLMCCGLSLCIKFANPDMTETQLCIEFFREWLLLLSILMLSWFIHIKWGAVVDQLKKAFKFHSGKWYKNKINIKIVISILISLILCISYNIDLLSLLGMSTFVPLIGEIVTAVIISSGASSVHNILSEFENLRTAKKIES